MSKCKAFLLLLLLSAGFSVHSQSLTPFVVASAGDFYTNNVANASLSFTVGELAIVETFTAQGNILTNGFQQPQIELVGLDESDFALEFVVFPNPANQVLNFRYTLQYPGLVKMHFTDMRGVQVLTNYSDKYGGGQVEDYFNLDGISQGMYFLHVSYDVPSKGIHYNQIHKINVIRH